MKRNIVLLLMCCSGILTGQVFNLEWQTIIESEAEVNYFSDPLIVDNHIIIDHSKSESSIFPDNHMIISVNPADGTIEKEIAWPNFIPERSQIELLKASETEFYFTADRARSYHYGKMNVNGEVLWHDSLQCAELIPVLLEEDLVLDISCFEGNNELLKVNKDGDILWSFEHKEYDARNKLFSNGVDRLLWLNNEGLSLWDSEGELISIDSINKYYEAYNHFHVGLDRNIYYLEWGSFAITVGHDMVEMFVGDTLDYSYDIFGTPNPTILHDELGYTFVSSDYDYDGKSFLQVYDSDFQPVWNIETDEQIVSMYRDSLYLIVLTDSSIRLFRASTGSELESYDMAGSNEVIHNRYRKEDFYDETDNALYFFTSKDSTMFLNQLKLDFSVSTASLSSEIDIYPNPVRNVIWLRNVKDRSPFKIYDIGGRRVIDSVVTDGRLDVSHLVSGVYLIEINNKRQKFIKL